MKKMPTYSAGSYKQEVDAEKRAMESQRIRAKYPGRLPIILEQARNCTLSVQDQMKRKFLVPGELTMGQFMYVVRRRLKLPSEKAVFMYTNKNNTLCPSSQLMAEVDAHYKDDDGFLYLVYSGETTFG